MSSTAYITWTYLPVRQTDCWTRFIPSRLTFQCTKDVAISGKFNFLRTVLYPRETVGKLECGTWNQRPQQGHHVTKYQIRQTCVSSVLHLVF